MVEAERGLVNPHGWKDESATRSSPLNSKRHLVRKSHGRPHIGSIAQFAHGTMRHISAFCVPGNSDMLTRWDRVADRLFKIRHCQDITGTFRQLALFAPPIDPNLLVAAEAAGLSLQDILSANAGNIPAYRFTYLLEKAKQYATHVQSFGSALLSALEKRDAEQLNLLRQTHEQNILALTTQMKQWDIESANNAIDALTAQQNTVQARLDYYQGLVEGGLNTWENAEAATRQAIVGLYNAAGPLFSLAGTLHLIPQLGSPFALKFGGDELGKSVASFGQAMREIAIVNEAIATAAGLAASFERRSDEWKHQVDQATSELAQLNKQMDGAKIRVQIAQRAFDMHQKSIDQSQEISDLMSTKFSNLGLYNWHSAQLRQLHQQAYSGALAAAQLAEQAYRFERSDETSELLINTGFWDAEHGGLLAGEKLLSALNELERRFIGTNYRLLEIEQPFSLMQFAPEALIQLRETATCNFTIPELFFDLYYPGHYQRTIKAVRVTIPSVTGPYTNISATLTLTGSQSRLTPDEKLQPVPLRRSVSIATSTAQNDSGVFEFSFRDERYMPFEGAGAVNSTWMLELPKNFRQFDYETIPDVILHISYTAKADGAFRTQVEGRNAELEGTILSALSKQALGRAYSLRQEFPTVFNRLTHSAANTPVKLSITDKYMPFFLRGRAVKVASAKLLLRTSVQRPDHLVIKFGDSTASRFEPDQAVGNLPAGDITLAFANGLIGDHMLSIGSGGDLAPASRPNADAFALDDSKLLDLILYLELKLPPPTA